MKGHDNTTKKIERGIHQKYYNVLSESNTSRTIENGINAYWEGEVEQVTLTTHERNINAHNKCIQSKGTKCSVCGFGFEKTYGELGKGFIHTHHVTPISNRDGRYEIEVENDLFPRCPNCHAMPHRKKDSTLSIEELKQIIQQNND